MAEFGSGSIPILADRDPGVPKRNRSNGFGSVTQFDRVIQLLFERTLVIISVADPGPSVKYVFGSHGSGIPDPGVKKAPVPGSGSATLLFCYHLEGQ